MKRLLLASALLLLAAAPAPPPVGAVAPDFRLMDQNSHIVRLAQAHGHKVVLVFYRGYW
ncbi:MAG TPA: redoxin domain-containing protein [Thermoanaerobaculia bacterium]